MYVNMDISTPLGTLDNKTLATIKKTLGEDDKTMENLVEMFRDWLKSEPCLPKDVGQNMIKFFIRHSQYDIELGKKKFETYLTTRMRLRNYLSNVGDQDHFGDMLNRQLIPLPKLTPKGYRVGFGIFPEDADHFDFKRTFDYAITLSDFLCLQDYCVGYFAVFDFKHLTAEYLGKLDINLLIEGVNFIYNTLAFKLIATHIVNMPRIPEMIINVIKRLVDIDVLNRIYIHKDVTDLATYIPEENLPQEYGGKFVGLYEAGDRTREYVQNADFKSQCQYLKYTGPLPYPKRDQHSFEDFELGSNIRKLNMD